MRATVSIALFASLLSFTSPVSASVSVSVHIPSQTMQVTVNGAVVHVWTVSTGKRGHTTPSGKYQPYWLSRHHRSKLYSGAPMPHAVFFSGNYAIHGTDDFHMLGRPASRGCVRLSRHNASVFFNLVAKYGKENTAVIIKGS